MTVILSNNEAFPVKVCIGTFPDDPGTVASSVQNVIDLGEQAQTTQWQQLSAQGGQDRAVLRLVTSYPKYIGHEIFYHASDYFYGTPTTNPITPIYQAILAYGTGNFTSAGLGMSVTLEITAKLFYRRIIVDSGPQFKSIARQFEDAKSKLDTYKSRLSTIDSDDEDANTTPLETKIQKYQAKIDHLKKQLDEPYSLLMEQ